MSTAWCWRRWWWWCFACWCGASALAPQLVCPPDLPCDRTGAPGKHAEHAFRVEGHNLLISFQDSYKFEITCNGNLTLDSASLPRFDRAVRVRLVKISQCAPPRVSYERSLRGLNVTLAPLSALTITAPTAPLCASHLDRLPLTDLTLDRSPRPCADLLNNLTHLTSLHLEDTPLPTFILSNLPVELESLRLKNVSVDRFSVELSRLRSLTVIEKSEVHLAVERAPALRQLWLDVFRAAVPDTALLPALESLTVSRWRERIPPAWKHCARLVNLTIMSPALHGLPAGWVAECPRLTRLTLIAARNLISLPGGLLLNATKLTHLTLCLGVLETLPMNLLDHTPNLMHLDLTMNRLTELPSGMFASNRALRSVNLSYNRLRGDVLHALAGLTELRSLDLAHNTALGDVCTGGTNGFYVPTGDSPIYQLTKLVKLNLSSTNVTLICHDWRNNMKLLETLDLSHTKVTRLTFEDTQQVRSVEGAVVDLRGARVETLAYDCAQYNRAKWLNGTLRAGESRAKLHVDSPLRCDCELYWAAAALRDAPRHARVPALSCAADPDELWCARPTLCAALPAACSCAVREDEALPCVASSPPPLLLRVRCEAAALRSVPRLSSLPNFAAVDLLLAGNRISNLTFSDLPNNLRTLDLRNNSVRVLDPETVHALASVPRVLLDDNRLACECTVAALATARWLPGPARCGDGRLLLDAVAACSAAVPLLSAPLLALLLALTLALVAFVARRPATELVKRTMRRICLWNKAEPSHLFVSFVGEDAAPVALQVTRWLEGRGRRVVAQERDWVAGCRVVEGVAAGVRAAQRTVAVVSRGWARRWPELRAAYSPALLGARLVLVLVEPDALAHISELVQYAAEHPRCVILWNERRLAHCMLPHRHPAVT